MGRDGDDAGCSGGGNGNGGGSSGGGGNGGGGGAGGGARPTWLQAWTLAYDTGGAMLVGVTWSYIVPLAALPDEGCPSSATACWSYIWWLLAYMIFATFTIPLMSLITVRRMSRRASRLSQIEQSDGEGSQSIVTRIVRVAFLRHSQQLLVMAFQLTWSVGNSTLLSYILAQLQYSLATADATKLKVGG